MPAAEPVFVALGSNLGDSAAAVREAMDRLGEFSAGPVMRSSLWQSASIDCPPGSPPFINAVARLAAKPGLAPIQLLRSLQALERAFGRQTKKIQNEPRTLDLDLIAFGRRQVNEPELVVPHPRAHLRAFVLAPLAEIAPEFVLPGQTRTAAELWRDLTDASACRRLDADQ